MRVRPGFRFVTPALMGLLGLAACADPAEDAAEVDQAVEVASPQVGTGKKILFDAAHGQHAGNADWVIDSDQCNFAQRFPTPSPREIRQNSPENTWTGGFSAFGIALAKAGYDLESLPRGQRFTYGDASNEQDLTNYDVLVTPEPNNRFTAQEKRAIEQFVRNGGGFLMIADHAIADRDNDGWAATGILNDLMVEMPLGIHFAMRGEPGSDITERHARTYSLDQSSPILYTGPFGRAGNGGFMLVGSTVMVLDPTVNPELKGQIWFRRSRPGDNKDVVFATTTYGQGRVAAVGDSSPGEDLTAACGRTYIGFDDPSHDNAKIFMNTIAWLTPGAPEL